MTASPQSDDPDLVVELPFHVQNLAGMRDEVLACGAACGLADFRLFRFLLAVNEIMTNAIRHAGGGGLLRLWCSGNDLWCEVTDEGAGIPQRFVDGRPARDRPSHLPEHGLFLARTISDAFEAHRRTPRGSRVLLRFALPAPRNGKPAGAKEVL